MTFLQPYIPFFIYLNKNNNKYGDLKKGTSLVLGSLFVFFQFVSVINISSILLNETSIARSMSNRTSFFKLTFITNL